MATTWKRALLDNTRTEDITNRAGMIYVVTTRDGHASALLVRPGLQAAETDSSGKRGGWSSRGRREGASGTVCEAETVGASPVLRMAAAKEVRPT